MNELSIAFCSDMGYWYQTLVTIESILRFSKENEKYIIYILLKDNPNQKQNHEIENIEKRYVGCKIIIKVAGQYFKNIKCHIPDITEPTYYRLLLPELLEEEKCLYLDSDIVVCENISELYNIDLTGYEVGGVVAPSSVVYSDRNFERQKKIGIPDMKSYINAGVLLMNLEELRNNNFSSNVRKIINLYFETQDQDIINRLCYGKIKLINLRYNAYSEYYPLDERSKLENTIFSNQIDDAYLSPAVIHYADKLKPWEFPKSSLALQWWKACNVSSQSSYFQNKYAINWINAEWLYNEKLTDVDILSDKGIRYLKSYKDIYIYGAGECAKFVINKIANELNINSIFVTKLEYNEQHINGIPVVEFEKNVGKVNLEAIILVATGKKYFSQIRRIILAKGIYKVIGINR